MCSPHVQPSPGQLEKQGTGHGTGEGMGTGTETGN